MTNGILKQIGGKNYNCKIVKGDDTDYLLKALKFSSATGKSFRPTRSRWENSDFVRILENNDAYAYLLSNGLKSQPDKIGICEEGYYDGKKHNSSSKILKIKSYVVNKFDGQLNDAIVFKVLLVPEHLKETFDEKKEGQVSSFSSTMVNQNVDDFAQLMRFDLTGPPHENCNQNKDFCTNKEEERNLYLKYFKKSAPTPHFHFFNTNGLDKYAITSKSLFKYLVDLLSCEEKSPLNRYSLGMPFLYIKQHASEEQEFVDGKTFVNNKFIVPDRNTLLFECSQKLNIIAKITNEDGDREFASAFENFTKKLLSINRDVHELLMDTNKKIPSSLMIAADKLLIINFIDQNAVRNMQFEKLSQRMLTAVIDMETNLANNLIGGEKELTKIKDFER